MGVVHWCPKPFTASARACNLALELLPTVDELLKHRVRVRIYRVCVNLGDWLFLLMVFLDEKCRQRQVIVLVFPLQRVCWLEISGIEQFNVTLLELIERVDSLAYPWVLDVVRDNQLQIAFGLLFLRTVPCHLSKFCGSQASRGTLLILLSHLDEILALLLLFPCLFKYVSILYREDYLFRLSDLRVSFPVIFGL